MTVTTTQDVANCLVDCFAGFLGGNEGCWVRREGGLLAIVSGIPLAMCNGIWAQDEFPSVEIFRELLDHVISSGLAFSVQLRPGADPEILALVAARGLVQGKPIPLMVLNDPSALVSAQDQSELVLRALDHDEIDTHITLVADTFGIPHDIASQFMTEEFCQRPEVTCYVGELDSVVVTTGLGMVTGNSVGIFNIATPPEYRGRGYGAAVTARAAADGFAQGADVAWLQASPMGFPVYERLGFVTPEYWDSWLSAS
jgi:ribosomal protein S18 acetylase RimI-like enzyme